MPTATKYAKETFWGPGLERCGLCFLLHPRLLLTRQMTVEVWGDWSAFLALLNIILLISDQGINAANKRYIAETRDSTELGGLVCATFTLRVLASLCHGSHRSAHSAASLVVAPNQSHRFDAAQSLLIALYRIMDYFKSLFEALHRLRRLL